MTSKGMPRSHRPLRSNRAKEPSELNPWVRTLVVPLAITLVGIAATGIYNAKQDQFRRVEAIEKFLPYFSPLKELDDALAGATALIDLGYADLAIDLLTSTQVRETKRFKAQREGLPPVKALFGDDERYIGFFEDHAVIVIPRLCAVVGRQSASDGDASSLLRRFWEIRSLRDLIVHELELPDVTSPRVKGALRIVFEQATEEAFGNGGGFIETWEQDGRKLASILRQLAGNQRLGEQERELVIVSLARISRFPSVREQNQLKPTVGDIRAHVEDAFIKNDKQPVQLRAAALKAYLDSSGYTDGGASLDTGVREILLNLAINLKDKDYPVRMIAARVLRGAFVDRDYNPKFLDLLASHDSNEQEIGVEGITSECETPPCKVAAEGVINPIVTKLTTHFGSAEEFVQVRILERMPEFPSDKRSRELMEKIADHEESYELQVTAFKALASDQRPESRMFVLTRLQGNKMGAAFEGVVQSCGEIYSGVLSQIVASERDKRSRESMRDTLDDRNLRCKSTH